MFRDETSNLPSRAQEARKTEVADTL